MKLNLEKIQSHSNSSWMMMDRQLEQAIPFEWHHHKEYELTLTLNSKGQRYIGDHIGQYQHADLVLLGPNLPHTWHSTTKINDAKPHHAIVMWFTQEWAQQLFVAMPELNPIANMLIESSRGIQFSSQISQILVPQIIKLVSQSESGKTVSLISILHQLTEDTHSTTLASPIYLEQQTINAAHTRIDRVLEYIHAHYEQDLKIETLANIAALSQSGFYRMFLRYTHHKPSDYITHLRIGKACALLIESQNTIANISDEVGFNSLVNFNRHFKRIKSQTPRHFRQVYAK
ncbi:MAG: AraC family transcriptional regulator [Hyphomicrobiales bacterium]